METDNFLFLQAEPHKANEVIMNFIRQLKVDNSE
jgi:hypothetical protein